MQRRKKKRDTFFSLNLLLLSYNQKLFTFFLSLYLSLTPSSLRTQRVQEKEGLFVRQCPGLVFLLLGRRAVSQRLKHTLLARVVLIVVVGPLVLGSIDFHSFTFFSFFLFFHLNIWFGSNHDSLTTIIINRSVYFFCVLSKVS